MCLSLSITQSFIFPSFKMVHFLGMENPRMSPNAHFQKRYFPHKQQHVCCEPLCLLFIWAVLKNLVRCFVIGTCWAILTKHFIMQWMIMIKLFLWLPTCLLWKRSTNVLSQGVLSVSLEVLHGLSPASLIDSGNTWMFFCLFSPFEIIDVSICQR